jgi:hypothetical protein
VVHCLNACCVSFEHPRRFPGRDDLSAIQHDDVVGNRAHFGRIVAHVDHRHAEFVADAAKAGHDLTAERQVERGQRFVGQQQRRRRKSSTSVPRSSCRNPTLEGEASTQCTEWDTWYLCFVDTCSSEYASR